MNMKNQTPLLVEPGLKFYLVETLQKCHNIKSDYYNILYNVCLFCLFSVILIVFMSSSYKGNMTTLEKEVIAKKKKSTL